MSDREPAPAAPASVWWADLTNADLSLVAWLDDAERGRFDRLDLDADRGRFLVGAALLRVAVEAATGRAREQIVVTRTCDRCGQPHGAPRVPGTAVSVAHAGSLVVVATAHRAVGVDVERTDRGDNIAQWVEQEARFKATSTPEDRPGGLQITALAPPLSGHVAALALPPGAAAGLVVHGLTTSAGALRA